MKKDIALQKLGKTLIGTWKISGEAKGKVKYEWLHEGLFLKQEFDIVVFGRKIKGLEIIGRLRRPGEKPTKELWSRSYIFAAGETFDYVYKLTGKNLTIWFGKPNSSNKFKGIISKDGKSYEGAWAWPGGGYRIKAERV